MKYFLLFIFPFLLFESCNDFYHLHYRKLNKVPAHPMVIEKQEVLRQPLVVNKFSPVESFNGKIPEMDSVVKTIVAIQPIEQSRHQDKIKPTKQKLKREERKSHKLFIPHFPKNEKQSADFFVFAILFILLLGLAMIIGGIWMLFLGIGAGTLWMIICGPLIFLIGLPLFIGMMVFSFGRKPKPSPAYNAPVKNQNYKK